MYKAENAVRQAENINGCQLLLFTLMYRHETWVSLKYSIP